MPDLGPSRGNPHFYRHGVAWIRSRCRRDRYCMACGDWIPEGDPLWRDANDQGGHVATLCDHCGSAEKMASEAIIPGG